MPRPDTYVEQLKVLERATQAEADRLQRKFVRKDRAHPYREKASQLQRKAALLRHEIKRRTREGDK
ncbi:hypothetical protein [Pseudoxanthomonas sp. JBR18]|uniref:hypothetical protein n=1 Tax=Pseudoxanthomonas sp. JBR18 TaxID=2969308 RepID=UPI0023054780|nr:hypothetical protein [Pseudoxanthomonas sp. JBR18]WCE04445.1 hypothetical protein PJ250_00075 [Pseudoxanthomonas sp. JBR18]